MACEKVVTNEGIREVFLEEKVFDQGFEEWENIQQKAKRNGTSWFLFV